MSPISPDIWDPATLRYLSKVRRQVQATYLHFEDLAKAYIELLRRNRIEHPPELLVSNEFAARSPVLCDMNKDRIYLTEAVADRGPEREVIGAICHEIGHLLNLERRGPPILDGLFLQRGREQRADRLGAYIAHSRGTMLRTRLGFVGEELAQIIPHSLQDSMAQRIHKSVGRQILQWGNDVLHGTDRALYENIKRVDLSDRSYVDRLIQQRNTEMAKRGKPGFSV
jgi:hypothetical protein